MKLLIAGGRDFNNIPLFSKSVNTLLDNESLKLYEVEIVSGLAKGADTLGYNLAIYYDLKLTTFPANWKDMSEPCVIKTNRHGTYNALAGMNRNTEMLHYCDQALIFWNSTSSGTKDMIQKLETTNKKCIVIKY